MAPNSGSFRKSQTPVANAAGTDTTVANAVRRNLRRFMVSCAVLANFDGRERRIGRFSRRVPPELQYRYVSPVSRRERPARERLKALL